MTFASRARKHTFETLVKTHRVHQPLRIRWLASDELFRHYIHIRLGHRALTNHYIYNGLTPGSPPHIGHTIMLQPRAQQPLHIQWFDSSALTKHSKYNGVGAARSPNITNTIVRAPHVRQTLRTQWSGRCAFTRHYKYNGLVNARRPNHYIRNV